MSWLGTIDFRIDGAASEDLKGQQENRFQLQCACMVIHVLRAAHTLETVQTIYEIISALAGDGIGSDSMTPMQLHELLGDRDILSTYFGGNAELNLRRLQDEIANRGLGTQAINGHPAIEASRDMPTRPPTAFAILGQQFVWSAFISSKIIFDQVIYDGAKVGRRIPSGVDVAFALFGNDTAGDVIASRMAASPNGNNDFVLFRDGLQYASNLIAVRRVVEDALAKADPETSSVALLWKFALRELSQASASTASTFHSATWQKRVMNTQLASFTQLRHDTILDAKQSYGFNSLCKYPAGYVDPYPSFWLKMNLLAKRMLAIVETLKVANPTAPKDGYSQYDTARERAKSCLNRFVSITDTLFEIATAQAQKEELTDKQVSFLKRVMAESHGNEDSSKPDPLVADVHTDPPSDEHGNPGGILHLGVGKVNLAMVIVDNTMYAGPVFSHYEFVTRMNERLTDDEFSERLPTLHAPQWATESFLVPYVKAETTPADLPEPGSVAVSFDGLCFDDEDY